MVRFVEASAEIRFESKNRHQVYVWVERVLVQQEYTQQGNAARGLVRRYIEKMTGLSRALALVAGLAALILSPMHLDPGEPDLAHPLSSYSGNADDHLCAQSRAKYCLYVGWAPFGGRDLLRCRGVPRGIPRRNRLQTMLLQPLHLESKSFVCDQQFHD